MSSFINSIDAILETDSLKELLLLTLQVMSDNGYTEMILIYFKKSHIIARNCLIWLLFLTFTKSISKITNTLIKHTN